MQPINRWIAGYTVIHTLFYLNTYFELSFWSIEPAEWGFIIGSVAELLISNSLKIVSIYPQE